MRSIRNTIYYSSHHILILDHWEMRSIRNCAQLGQFLRLHFRSLGNALYPEHITPA